MALLCWNVSKFWLRYNTRTIRKSCGVRSCSTVLSTEYCPWHILLYNTIETFERFNATSQLEMRLPSCGAGLVYWGGRRLTAVCPDRKTTLFVNTWRPPSPTAAAGATTATSSGGSAPWRRWWDTWWVKSAAFTAPPPSPSASSAKTPSTASPFTPVASFRSVSTYQCIRERG